MQSVHACEPSESVRTPDEVRRESGREMGALASQIAQRSQPIPHRGLAAHGDRVAVLEAERGEPAHAVAAIEFALHVRVEQARVCGKRVGEGIVQHRQQPRARVLGIHIYCTRAQSAERDLGRAESWSPVHRDPARF